MSTSGPTTIRRVSHSEILGAHNAQELIDEYAAECSIPEIGPAEVQPEMYAVLEQLGMLAIFGLYQCEELIGFGTVLRTIAPNYGRNVATAQLFVSAAHREGVAGRALLAALEDHARQESCVAIIYSARPGSRFARVLEASDAYTCTNVVYCRSLA
jgi:GNAT superfamily N-acetyltransferase